MRCRANRLKAERKVGETLKDLKEDLKIERSLKEMKRNKTKRVRDLYLCNFRKDLKRYQKKHLL